MRIYMCVYTLGMHENIYLRILFDCEILFNILLEEKIETYGDTYMTCLSETSAIHMLSFKINLSRPEYFVTLAKLM